MFCPICKAEYRQGFTRCADCEVDLVYSLDQATQDAPGAAHEGRLVPLWVGDDLPLHVALLEELKSAGIPFFDRPAGGYPGTRKGVPEWMVPRPLLGFEVEVLSSDLSRAQQILENLATPCRNPTMVCPLCMAEFGEGFTLCSDCHVALLRTEGEANAARARLWKGDRQTELDRILAALDAAQIRSYHKEIVNSSPRLHLFTVVPVRPSFEYEVWIFRDDLERAQLAIREERDEES